MITIIFITIAAIFNSLMDTLSFHYNQSIFVDYPQLRQFLDVNHSWRNKYKNKDHRQGRAFFGSTTFLVWLTDGWHLFKCAMLLCFAISIVFYKPLNNPVLDIFIFYVWFGIVFELFFAYVLKRN
jgi:hypothetical protein